MIGQKIALSISSRKLVNSDMGLCIYYKGKFNNSKSLIEMIEEVRDVAEAYKWNYNIFETAFPEEHSVFKTITDDLYGISLWPENCEPVYFAFLSNREMGSAVRLQYYEQSKRDGKNTGWICTKTQYAGMAVHKVIIHLYDYISKKYFTEFDMMDESEYWETRKDDVMKKNFDQFDFAIDQMAFYLENIEKEDVESMEDYLQRLIEVINKNRS